MRSLSPVSTRGRASLAKPGSTPLTNRDTPPGRGRALQGGDHRGHPARGTAGTRARRHHVDPGPEEPVEVGQRLGEPVVGHGGVDDARRAEGEQRVGVVGGGHAQGASEAGELAGVPTDLVGVGDPDARPARGRGGRRSRRWRAGRRCRCSMRRLGRAVSWCPPRAVGHDCGRRLRGRAGPCRGWATRCRRRPRGSCR